MAHLSEERRNEFRRELYQCLRRHQEISVVACATNVKEAYDKPYIENEEDLYHETYKQVSERFQFFLQDKARREGRDEAGLMVADARGRQQDDALRDKHRDFLEGNKSNTINYKNFIETVFLSPSHHSTGIQFADMVAGAVGRYFNANDDTFFKLVEPTFRRSPKNDIKGFGLIRFPK